MKPSEFEQLEQTSDAVDEGKTLSPILPAHRYLKHVMLIVNQLKGNLWDSEAEFSKDKDTTKFRQYAEACDRVKSFYLEQHSSSSCHLYSPPIPQLRPAAQQTLRFNVEIRKRFAELRNAEMGKFNISHLIS